MMMTFKLNRSMKRSTITRRVCPFYYSNVRSYSSVFRQFLSRVSILLLTRDIDIVILSVRLSVRDTLVLYENGLTYRHSFPIIR